MIVEVQLRPDPRKRRTWPAYVATLYARLECPAMLLVVCPDPAVAVWCAKPIVVTEPGLTLTPVVLGPRQIPVFADVEAARRHPELTVLSALAYAHRPDPTIDFPFEPLLAALGIIDPDHAKLYVDTTLKVLPPLFRKVLEDLMVTTGHRYQSDFARRYFTEGEAQGKAEGKAEALLAILEARGVHVPADTLAEITACTDIIRLETWIRRAVTADKIQDVVD